jgi:hypothetical protein
MLLPLDVPVVVVLFDDLKVPELMLPVEEGVVVGGESDGDPQQRPIPTERN